MSIDDLAEQVKNMRGLILESNRTLIAFRFANMLRESLVKNHPSMVKTWDDIGHHQFLADCEIHATKGVFDPEMQIPGNELSRILDRWSRTDKYREKDGDEWKDIPLEAQQIIGTFIHELRTYNAKVHEA